jgi:hypothetical protein
MPHCGHCWWCESLQCNRHKCCQHRVHVPRVFGMRVRCWTQGCAPHVCRHASPLRSSHHLVPQHLPAYMRHYPCDRAAAAAGACTTFLLCCPSGLHDLPVLCHVCCASDGHAIDTHMVCHMQAEAGMCFATGWCDDSCSLAFARLQKTSHHVVTTHMHNCLRLRPPSVCCQHSVHAGVSLEACTDRPTLGENHTFIPLVYPRGVSLHAHNRTAAPDNYTLSPYLQP